MLLAHAKGSKGTIVLINESVWLVNAPLFSIVRLVGGHNASMQQMSEGVAVLWLGKSSTHYIPR